MRLVRQSLNDGLALMELFLGEAGDRWSDAGLVLDKPDFQGVRFGFRLDACWKVFSDALPREPAGHAIDDLPGGIREF